MYLILIQVLVFSTISSYAYTVVQSFRGNRFEDPGFGLHFRASKRPKLRQEIMSQPEMKNKTTLVNYNGTNNINVSFLFELTRLNTYLKYNCHYLLRKIEMYDM